MKSFTCQIDFFSINETAGMKAEGEDDGMYCFFYINLLVKCFVKCNILINKIRDITNSYCYDNNI